MLRFYVQRKICKHNWEETESCRFINNKQGHAYNDLENKSFNYVGTSQNVRPLYVMVYSISLFFLSHVYPVPVNPKNALYPRKATPFLFLRGNNFFKNFVWSDPLQRISGNPPDYCIIKIEQNTVTSRWDSSKKPSANSGLKTLKSIIIIHLLGKQSKL